MQRADKIELFFAGDEFSNIWNVYKPSRSCVAHSV